MAMEFIAPQRYFARPYSELAPAYDAALGISNFIGTRAAFEALVRRYGIQFRSAADLGCGTGLFAGYLNQCWGVPVFGVDRSPEMLAVATRNFACRNVCFLQQDMRCLRLPSPVDLITANFDTMNHLLTEPDLRLAFRRISENLRPGGHFIFDLITPCQPLARCADLHPTPRLRKLQRRATNSLEPRSENSFDRGHHSLAVLQSLNVGSAS